MNAHRKPILTLWAALIVCVIVGSLLPASSRVLMAVGKLPVNDKVLHFGAYLALALLPVIGFPDRRGGIAWAFRCSFLAYSLKRAKCSHRAGRSS